jgi:hypothetical protein
MSLNALTPLEMLGISRSWIDPARYRPVFITTPLLAPLLPVVEVAHADLVASNSPAESPADVALKEELAALRVDGVEADKSHDRFGGGALMILQGMERCAETPEEAAEIAAVRTRLFPHGASIFKATWLAEAGATEVVEGELTDQELSARLDRIHLWNKRSLLSVVRAWVSAGHQLGVLEARKNEAQTRHNHAPVAPTAQRVSIDARAAWIQTVTAVRTNAALVTGKGAEAIQPMLRALDAAEAVATERGVRQREAAVPSEPTAENETEPTENPLAAVV